MVCWLISDIVSRLSFDHPGLARKVVNQFRQEWGGECNIMQMKIDRLLSGKNVPS